ncbi:MAG: alpha/beta hydrolase [Anaerolineae bacterium]|nr:alpha/beta hydrolase [Anaerolineae bacterium]
MSMTSNPVPDRHLPQNASIYKDLAYVANGHERQTLDLYLPASLPPTGKLPLIIWIHGGAFRMGSKDDTTFDLVPLEYLTQGYAIASINYRLSQHAKFPAQIEDCKAAVRWLRAHADHYRLDATRFAAWGPSAGGYLSAMLGTAGWVSQFEVGAYLDQSSDVQCVVDHFGPSDFLQMDAQRLPDGMIHDDANSPESELIGGAIQDHPDAVKRANPITYVTPQAPPFLVVHGDADPLVPYGQSVVLVNALQHAKVAVTFYTVKGGGHGRFTDPLVSHLTREFLAKHLYQPLNQAGINQVA